MTTYNSFRSSLIISFIIQLITGIITLYTLFIPIPIKYHYLYSLIGLETIVQFIEAVFYLFFIYYRVSATQASVIRYFDWFVTTPIMVFTTVAFFFFNSNLSSQYNSVKNVNGNTDGNTKNKINWRERSYLLFKNKIIDPLIYFINYSNHKRSLTIILISNFLMLLFGLLGELRKISIRNATLWGFVFFLVEFYYIYTDFVIPYGDLNIYLYYILFTIIWGLYGIAYPFADNIKNTMYNILDLISKNIYGLLLGYYVYVLRETI